MMKVGRLQLVGRPRSLGRLLFILFGVCIAVGFVHNLSALLRLKAVVPSTEATRTVERDHQSTPSLSSVTVVKTSSAAYSDTAAIEQPPASTPPKSLLPWYKQITECVDHHVDCPLAASQNQCAVKPQQALVQCPLSCQVCNNMHDTYMSNCYGEDQLIPVGPDAAQTLQHMDAMQEYMLNRVYTEDAFSTVRSECKNRSENCTWYASLGFCPLAGKNAMTVECAPACMTCELLDYDTRCPGLTPETAVEQDAGAWKPGDLQRTFERIVKDDSETYNVTTLSSPETGGPWLLTLDDFLSPQECDRLIELGYAAGFGRSGTGSGRSSQAFKKGATGRKESDIKIRTSSTAWCMADCASDPQSVAVRERVAALTGIPDQHYEHLQLLRYETGQFYKVHTDYISTDRTRPQGVRVLTVFMYLNDVQEGGGTHFHRLNMTVQPKRGRVVVWPSVLNDTPHEFDKSTEHEALEVKAGMKYSINGWIHQRDFQAPYSLNCHQRR